jgi:hypothetical protein
MGSCVISTRDNLPAIGIVLAHDYGLARACTVTDLSKYYRFGMCGYRQMTKLGLRFTLLEQINK